MPMRSGSYKLQNCRQAFPYRVVEGLPVIRQMNSRGEADSRNQSLRNGSKNSQESELLQFAGHFEESDFERVRF